MFDSIENELKYIGSDLSAKEKSISQRMKAEHSGLSNELSVVQRANYIASEVRSAVDVDYSDVHKKITVIEQELADIQEAYQVVLSDSPSSKRRWPESTQDEDHLIRFLNVGQFLLNHRALCP